MKKIFFLITLCLTLTFLVSCKEKPVETEIIPLEQRQVVEANDTIYQLLVYAFADSNDDGIGDFKGISEHIDYFTYLGIDTLWLSPIHPSPSYHSYDITDYYGIKDDYIVDGYTFENLVNDLKAHDIDVIMDMVINHASNQHPFFKEALNAFVLDTESEYLNYFLFSKTPYTNVLSGFPYARARGVYYDGFYGLSSMPSWNFDYQPVKDMFLDIFKYWLDLGVAGFRLDASKHLYDNQIKNIQLLNMYKTELDKDYDDVFFVNEVWSTESEIIQYYGSQMHNLNFIFRDYALQSMSGSVHMSSHLENFMKLIRLKYSEGRMVPFLSNHDMGRLGNGLTLDENKMLGSLLILSPGNSIMYYGDEIMLQGIRTLNSYAQGYDDAAYRTPMLWDSTTNKTANYIQEGTNNAILSAKTTSTTTVEDSIIDQNSLLNHYKKLIEIKKEYATLTSGKLERVHLDDRLITYQISNENEILLVIHNMTNQTMNIPLDKDYTLLHSISLTTDFEMIDDLISIPAKSSTIIRLSEKLDLPDKPLQEAVYLRGTFSNWALSPTYLMSYTNGEYVYQLIISSSQEFKVFRADQWYGYNSVTNKDQSYISQELVNGNIILAPGNYTITFNNGEISIIKR